MTMEPISIVLIISMYLKLVGPIFSTIWKLYVDNFLSTILFKIEKLYDTLLHFNVTVNVKKKLVWLVAIGFFIDFMLYIIVVFMYLTEFKSQMTLLQKVSINTFYIHY